MKTHQLLIVFTLFIIFIQSVSTFAFPILQPMTLLSNQQNRTTDDRYDQIESRLSPFT